MCENRDLVIPGNILTYLARAPFSWAARHTTVCLDIGAGISAILVPLSNVPKLLLSLHSLTALLSVFIVAGVSISCVTFIEGFHYSWYLNWQCHL